MKLVYDLDDIIPFSVRHKGETIRQIVRYDSGYLRDLMRKDKRLIFSPKCLKELIKLTQFHKDNWENANTQNVFLGLKRYATPYLCSFCDEELIELNESRLKKTIYG